MNVLITIILGLIIVFTPSFIYLGKQYLKPYVEKQRILKSVMTLYHAYNKACESTYQKNYSVGNDTHFIERDVSTSPIVDNVYVAGGLCSAIAYVTKTWDDRDKVLRFLADHVDIHDLKWKTTLGRYETDLEGNQELERIRYHGGTGMWWFPKGDVVVRRDFLKRVLIQNGKLAC